MTATALPTADRTAPATSDSGRLSLSLCLTFGIGTVGTAILLNTVTTYLPALMSTVLGRSAALAGLLLSLSKLYDIGADLTIGMWSDRTRSRWGRRRPFLLAGAIVSALSFWLIFAPPALKGEQLTLYIAAMLVLYSTGYSLFNVPYVAMPAEMTHNRQERTRILSFRTFFAAAGQILALALAAWLIQVGGAGAAGFRLMGGAMAGTILVTTLVSFFGTAKAVQTERTTVSGLSALKQVRLLAANRPLVLLMGTKFVQFISLAILTSTGLLFRAERPPRRLRRAGGSVCGAEPGDRALPCRRGC